MRFVLDIQQLQEPIHEFPRGSYRVSVIDESCNPPQAMAVFAPTFAEAIDGASQALIERIEDDL